ncbi:hypothetical protein [Marinigracilibium pacificum]|uniref:Outer membrane protein with beta-barrel domain n=1 Tax=Marinigracilibium pacificum TaxID=2729599 RepID=A0A848J8Y2_9BACT|nr:hypothetical protein [Marinigracilibium pacificum]NMM50839.1 hypothetical protein [Marinigracilibium pacificum]
MTRLFFFGLLFSIGILNAQTDFKPGYIILNSGDTLHGEIDYRGDLLMSSVCKFKTNGNSISTYDPSDIAAFRFINSKYYISKEINSRKVFLEFLIKGEVNIYYMRDDDGDHYFIEKEGIKLSEIPYEEKIMYVDGKKVLYESTTHKGLLFYFMRDVPEFNSRIQTIEKPEHHSLIRLAEDYHNAVCEDRKCIIYEKKLPIIKISLAPFMGVTKYRRNNNYINEYGAIVSFWSPRASEKLFFKTGLIHHQFSTEGEDISIYKIPLQIQYIFRAHRLQPNLSAGVNFLNVKLNDYKEIRHTLSLNAGLDYKLFKRTHLSSSFNTDYTPLSRVAMDETLEFGLISYSLTFGLRFDL